MKPNLFVPVLAVSMGIFPLSAREREETHVPSPVIGDDFNALKGQSPFLRSLNLSDSLILTGIAMVEDEQVATLLNKDTNETFVVSSQLNSQGWKMVELKADKDLEKVAAKVAVDGGEVVTVRYAEWQLKPGESKPGAGPSMEPPIAGTGEPRMRPPGTEGEGSRRYEGRRGPPGGPGGGPSPEFRERMSQLSEEQRSQLFQKMSELRERNPEMSSEDRGKAMSEIMDRVSKGQ